ncbi:cobalamin-5'-phosphate synthase [Roseovarius nanhaiticus]|uniref:Adenosylcobinamide-GDP ribazoletransferase n=1 Tax=Roseovarius nanhaiticus TaxID=573024 RepID=A0A1N7HD18_9RHOB|nr:adenosylcobinamide-GDP ribazoletransferase [Roseovarius nanhaiticus]SEL01720.1 cobalamin-5'-phosphate synthase [Roseovarius nanhaiticus]SIS22777.1 cobalamin-5'-phosphate synthase [Roseovarius nanhaiticus]
MSKNDIVLNRLADIHTAAALLTRLPLPHAPMRGAGAAWAYPLIGAALGLMAGLVGLIAHACGLPPALAALAALAAQVILTGAMHEDGLADSADGLWGGWTRARRLEIMKDSSIGAYGVIALVLSLAARWSALWLMFQMDGGWALAALVTAGAVSRAAMPAMMWALPHARGAGLSHGTGRPDGRACAIAAGLAFGTGLLLLGWAAIPVVIWAALVSTLACLIARAKIGGQTGDTLGAAQQMAEITVLLSILA